MITMLMWLLIWFCGEAAKWLSKVTKQNVSIRFVVMWIALIGWAIYYYFNQTDPALVENLVKFIAGSYAVSQVIWAFVDKFIYSQTKSI